MRFRFGPIPENPDFEPVAAGWRALREPGPILFQVLAAPVGLVVTGLVLAGWWLCGALRPQMSESLGIGLLVTFAVTVPVHELIHGLLHPKLGRSDASVYGLWPQTLLFYAHYDDALSRNRFLVVLLAPFLVLSVVPLLVCWLSGWSHWFFVTVSVINALSACGDLTGASLVVSQIPAAAMVRNRGYYTWWKAGAESSSEPGEPLERGAG